MSVLGRFLELEASILAAAFEKAAAFTQAISYDRRPKVEIICKSVSAERSSPAVDPHHYGELVQGQDVSIRRERKHAASFFANQNITNPRTVFYI